METKKCEACGKELPITEFSKSYKNRCKECVVEGQRMRRHSSNGECVKVDWDARRYELAKEAMIAILGRGGYSYDAYQTARDAVQIAIDITNGLQHE